MSELYRVEARPELERPVLVVGLDGWIDAGFGAAGAVVHLRESLDLSLVASFDTEALLDHRSRRPVLHLENGVNTGLTWPAIELHHGRDPAGNDVLLLTGAEPDVRWRGFAAAVVDLATELGVHLVVGLGAYPAPLPHTRTGRLATTATTPELAARVPGAVHATLDVPAGAGAAIEEACAERGLPAVGLWAQVPHYSSGMAYPDASAALVEGLAELAGLQLDSHALRETGTALRRRLDALVAENEEHVAMVRNLEAAHDAQEADGSPPGLGTLPSGDELAAELERFLREVDTGNDGP